ncbi:MAG: MMPL family transporter [Acidobacteriota bacterium]
MTDRLLQPLLRFVFRRRRLMLLGAAIVGALSMWLLGRIQFDTNVLNLLPSRGPAVSALQTYLSNFGNLDRLFVMFEAPPDHTIAEYRDQVDEMVERLRALPDLASVDAGLGGSGVDWSYVLDRQLLLLGPSGVPQALSRLGATAMDADLLRARDRISLAPEAMGQLVQQDPLDLIGLVRAHLTEQAIPLTFNASEDGYLSPDGRARLVIARPVRPPFDTGFSRALNAKLDAVWHAPGDPSLPALAIKEAGGYRVSVEAEDLIRNEGSFNGLITLGSIIAIVVIVFRSLRPLVVVVIPMLLASVATIAVYGTIHPMSMVAAGSVAMLFGLGEDGGTLMYVTYLQRRRAGEDAETAAVGLSEVGLSMAIGFATTAATFLGLTAIDFPALEELGLLIGVGILACGLCTLILVPALLPRNPPAAQLREFRADGLARFTRQWRTPILVVSAALTVVLGVGATFLKVSPTVDKLDAHTPARAVEREIAKRFNLPEDAIFVVSEGPQLEPLLAANQQLKDRLGPDIAASWPVDFLPPASLQAQTAAVITASGITRPAVVTALDAAARRTGFRSDVFGPFVGRLDRLLDTGDRLTVDGYQSHGLGSIISRYVSQSSSLVRTVAYISPRSPADVSRVEQAMAQIGGPMRLTGIPIVNAELKHRFRSEFLTGASIGTAGVLLLLLVGFRRWAPTLQAATTTGLGILWSTGLLALAGVELDLLSVFAVLMSVGVGVDYAVHLIHRRETDPARSMTKAVSETAPAILLAAATTIIGFGSLVTSSYRPLASLGLVSGLSITACLVTALIVLPAWLADRP